MKMPSTNRLLSLHARLTAFSIRSLLSVWTLVLFFVCGPSLVCAEEAVFRAAAAEVNITPTEPISIVGPGSKSTGVADELFARVLVIDDGTAPIAIITTDLVGTGIAYATALRESIEKETGIPASRVMFNCSHSHNAPGAGLPADSKTPSYGREVLQKITKITAEAMGSLEPARVAVGRESVQIGFNRRMPAAWGVTMTVNPDGPVVPWVDVIGVYGENNKRIGILFAYAAHPVVIHSSSSLISADYPGYAVMHLHKMLMPSKNKGGVLMFAQGCGGNINAFPLKGGLDACSRVGLVLGQAVTRVQLEDIAPADIHDASYQVDLPIQQPPPAEELDKLLTKSPGDLRYQRLKKLSQSKQPKTMPYPMSAFAIGDEVCIIALPHETFCDYQLWAVEKSPYKHTLVFGYTNGIEGYVAAKKDYDLGYRAGYEASPTPHRMPPSAESETIIKDGISQLWKKLKEQRRGE